MSQDHDKQDDLFRRMADKLRSHAEPYREGAWEAFAAKSGIGGQPKKKAWPYWAAAAVLLVAVSAALLVMRPSGPAGEPYAGIEGAGDAVATTPMPSPAETEVAVPGEEEPLPAARQTPEQTLAVKSASAEKPATSATEAGLPVIKDVTSYPEIAGVVDTEIVTVSKPDEAVQTEITQQHAETDPLIAEAGQETLPVTEAEEKTGQIPDGFVLPPLDSQATYAEAEGMARNGTADEGNSRWDLAVVLSPSMTSEKVNMGGGVAVAYRISDKFSISSGVSLSEMGVGQYPAGSRHSGRQYDAEAYYQSTATGDRQTDGLMASNEYLGNSYLTSVTSSLLAMDVPIDFRYHVSKRFYSSVGVSMFAVLEERRTVHYATTTMTQNLNGMQYNRREFSQRSAVQPIAEQRVGGFLNFSLGHRVPLSERVSLSLEPYFKMPLGGLSQQDMNLNHGGLKIVTGF